MKYLITLLTVLTVLLLAGCSTGQQPQLPDAAVIFADAATRPFECQTDLMYVDFYHCGACDNRCPASDADMCVDGECRCGLHPQCAPGSDCRSGQCVEVDLEGTVCEFDEECVPSHACIEGHCSFVECVPEVCNGVDDDCDGLIDNSGPAPLAEFCYTDEPLEEMLRPPCSQGVRTCAAGAWTECLGAVAPMAEVGILGCNGVDDDCDGCVDSVEVAGRCERRTAENFDVLFAIDQSGSMTTSIEIVRQSVRLFSTRLSTPAFRWGIVRIPDGVEGRPELYLDLSTLSVFEPALRGMSFGLGGVEPQWDAVYEAATGELGVSWRADAARIIILFTDEPGQSTRAARTLGPNLTERTMCDALEHGEVLVSVVNPLYREDFDDCAHRVVDLPSGHAGSGYMCSRSSDCDTDETCEVNVCVTTTVVETAAQLDFVIGDPCGS